MIEDIFLDYADELLQIYDLEDILDQNDMTPRELVARLIEDGLVLRFEDMRNR